MKELKSYLGSYQKSNHLSVVKICAQNHNKLLPMKGSRFRIDGGGRKLTDVELEVWIYERCTNMLRVSRKLIMFKAKSIYDEKYGNNEAIKNAFIASNSWYVKFMSRNNLSLRTKSAAQKDWSHLTGKLVGYVMLV